MTTLETKTAPNPVLGPERESKPLAKTLIICDRLVDLEKHLYKVSGPVRFLTLVDTVDSRSICDWLRNRPGTHELSKPHLFRERSGDFWKKYIEFLGQLNINNHSSDWWALKFTAKSPLATDLGLNIFQFLLIVELLGKEPDPLVVITGSPELISQTKAWAKVSGVDVVSLAKIQGGFRRFFKLNTPSGVLRASVRTFIFWLLTRRLRTNQNAQKGHLVIATQTHPQSFNGPEPYRDSYFGPLINHVASGQQPAVIMSLMVDRPFEQVRLLKSRKFGIPIRPVESWVTLKDIFISTVRAVRGSIRRFEPAEPVELDGIDLRDLICSYVREARRSGDYFLNLLMFYCGRSLGRSLNVEKCLYPYENRAWEKSFMQGLRSSSPGTKVVGYQHASVAPIHANFFLGEGEASVIPLPDQILTTGEVVQKWLENVGNYPDGLFKTACALRQSAPASGTPKERRGKTSRVLVALATNFTEHVNTVVFVEQAFRAVDGFEVRIRPHPAFSLEQVIEDAPLGNREFFNASLGSLADDIEWADVVLYATSTVALEAVSLGTPAVQINLGEFLDTDPMFGWDEFKWSVSEPSQLVETIRRIEKLTDSEYLDRQRKGQEYTAAYLRPVTLDSLRLFCEAT